MLLKDLLTEFLFNCQCRKLSDRTTNNYKKQINYLLNFLEEQNITEIEGVLPQHIKQFLIAMKQKGRTSNYQNDLLKAFKVFFKYCYNEKYIDKIITEKIKNAKMEKVIIRTFSDEELKRMIKYYNKMDFLTFRNKVIVSMLIDTGIRLSELLNLTEEQIKFDYIIINGKGNKQRVVPKSPQLSMLLIKYLNIRKSFFYCRNTPNNIFLSRNAKPLSAEMISRIVKEAAKHSNVSKDIRVSPHTFRHTYAQYQLKNGLDIYTLSRLLGHESISVTQIYLNGIRDTQILCQAQKTSPLMNL